jgi:membrane-associated phospholipid phosphatase
VTTRAARVGRLAALAAALSPGLAGAAPAPQPELTDTATAAAPLPRPSPFLPEEYGVTAGLLVGLTGATVLIPTAPNGWRGEIGPDAALRDLLRVEGRDARERISTASDVLQNLTLTVPFLVDIGVGALLLRRDPDLALELLLIDAEALAAASALVVLTKRTVGRVRPDIPECEVGGGYGCRSNASRRAFISGHAAAAFSSAGLVCVHHQHLRLFGGPGDAAMCVGMLGLAVTSSVLRVVADRHWSTDVAAGALTGLLTGYALPYLLHYQGPWRLPEARDGRLDGSLALYGLTGVTRLDREGGISGGVGVELRALFGRRAVQVEGYVQGRLLYDSVGLAVRDVAPAARVWLGPVGLGGTLVYRSHQRDDAARVALTYGPTLSLGTFDEDHPVTLSVSWLPGGDGAVDLWSARLAAGLIRHLALSVEVSPLLAPTLAGDGRGTAVVLGAGGRLPW